MCPPMTRMPTKPGPSRGWLEPHGGRPGHRSRPGRRGPGVRILGFPAHRALHGGQAPCWAARPRAGWILAEYWTPCAASAPPRDAGRAYPDHPGSPEAHNRDDCGPRLRRPEVQRRGGAGGRFGPARRNGLRAAAAPATAGPPGDGRPRAGRRHRVRPGPARCWWAVAGVAALVLAAGLSIAWIASQGGGRTPSVARESDGGRGTTVVETGLVSAAVKQALDGNRLVLGGLGHGLGNQGHNGTPAAASGTAGSIPPGDRGHRRGSGPGHRCIAGPSASGSDPNHQRHQDQGDWT